MSHRILCALPALPDRTTGGGVLLYETLLYLLTRGSLHVVVPVPRHLAEVFSELQRDNLLSDVVWHSLQEVDATSAIARILSPTPIEVRKFAHAANQAILEATRKSLSPTAELLISSRAIAPYARFALPSRTRLYMMDVDPRIMRYRGPSWKRRLASAIEYPKVDRLCRHALRSAARVGAISTSDVADLNSMGAREDVLHVPPLMKPRPIQRAAVDAFHVLITTNFSYSPNIEALGWFLRECWPHVDARTTLTVTGIDDRGTLARMCTEHPRITYAGCLPREQLDQLFARVTLAVNPTRSGSGFQIKLLDALARGVPIVSTAFSNRIGNAIPSSDDPVELAKLINARLEPTPASVFHYPAFYDSAVNAWDHFLFD